MLIVVQCWITQGWEPNEKTQPILWIEYSTGALVVHFGHGCMLVGGWEMGMCCKSW
jgi:hypothetical protein